MSPIEFTNKYMLTYFENMIEIFEYFTPSYYNRTYRVSIESNAPSIMLQSSSFSISYLMNTVGIIEKV